MLLFFGLCIFVHELGHFVAAKWRGLHIVAFSLGFKKIWSFKRGGVEYRIGMLPFGGYVDIPQLDTSGDAKTEEGVPLPTAKPVDRIITAFAGPLFNVFFGLLLGTFLWIHGIPQDTPRMRSFEVATVDEDSPEYRAGLRPGDVIYAINGKKFHTTWSGMVENVLFTIGDVTLNVRRGAEDLNITYTPVENSKMSKMEKMAYPFFKPRIPVIIDPFKDSPAMRAGLKRNDTITKVNGEVVHDLTEFVLRVDRSNGALLVFTVIRDGREIEIKGVMPEKEKEDVKNNTYKIGVEKSSSVPVIVNGVIPGMPAQEAGIEVADQIESIDGKKLTESEQLNEIVSSSEGKKLVLGIIRGDKKLEIAVIPKIPSAMYTIGAGFVFYNHPNPIEQFVDVMDKTYKSFKSLLSKKSSIKPKHMSGPAGIVHAIWIVTYMRGFVMGLYIVVFITYSLAVFNLLPIPVLDGGHIAMACFEIVFRRKVPEAVLKPVMYLFVVLLISLMLFVTFNDFRRFVNGFMPEKPVNDPPKTEKPADVANPAKP